jgi:hypothetical protein
MDPKRSRGFRNRNPGNIDYVPANRWLGQVGIETGVPNPRFAVFESHEYGIRALAALLTTYQDRHGLRTVSAIIGRWAPGSENDTGAYVRHVASLIGRPADAPLDLHRWEDMRALVVAIITHELGGQPYADAVLDEGLRRAGLARPVGTIREAAQTGTGRGAVSVATAASAAAAAAPVISALADLPAWTSAVLVVAVAVVAVAWILAGRRAVA